jgi:hypothetical protein
MSPQVTVAGPLLLMLTSGHCTVVVTVLEVLLPLDNSTLLVLMLAALLIDGAQLGLTVAVMVTVAEPLAASAPRVAVTTLPAPTAHVPWLGVHITLVKQSGRSSVRVTFEALASPVFCAVSVKLIVLPQTMVAGPLLLIVTSGHCTVVVTVVDVLLAIVDSGEVVVTLAVLLIDGAQLGLTVAVIVTVAEPPAATVPRLAVTTLPAPTAQVPWLGVHMTLFKQSGRSSVTVTVSALVVPPLVTVSV